MKLICMSNILQRVKQDLMTISTATFTILHTCEKAAISAITISTKFP